MLDGSVQEMGVLADSVYFEIEQVLREEGGAHFELGALIFSILAKGICELLDRSE